jgi:carboxylesterase
MPFQPTYPVPEDRRPYTLQAGRAGILMLHGYIGSPKSSRPLAAYLAERGVTVHCPLLPGHGNVPNKMYGVSRHDWMAEAEEGLTAMRQMCDKIFLMGHSMGAVLSAYLIQKNRDIRGMIMLAPLYEVPDKRIHLMRVLRYVMPWFHPLKSRSLQRLVYERAIDFDPTLDLSDPAVQAQLPELSKVPTGSMDEMRKVADLGKKLWPKTNLPAIIFQGGHDRAVSPGNAQHIFDLLPHKDKKLYWLPEAGHELMRPFDPAHAKVWPLILRFVQERSA